MALWKHGTYGDTIRGLYILQSYNNQAYLQYLWKDKGDGKKRPRTKAGNYSQLLQKDQKEIQPGKVWSWPMILSSLGVYVYRN